MNAYLMTPSLTLLLSSCLILEGFLTSAQANDSPKEVHTPETPAQTAPTNTPHRKSPEHLLARIKQAEETQNEVRAFMHYALDKKLTYSYIPLKNAQNSATFFPKALSEFLSTHPTYKGLYLLYRPTHPVFYLGIILQNDEVTFFSSYETPEPPEDNNVILARMLTNPALYIKSTQDFVCDEESTIIASHEPCLRTKILTLPDQLAPKLVRMLKELKKEKSTTPGLSTSAFELIENTLTYGPAFYHIYGADSTLYGLTFSEFFPSLSPKTTTFNQVFNKLLALLNEKDPTHTQNKYKALSTECDTYLKTH